MNRLLIIEDEESIRMLLEDDFRLEGYEVSSVDNGLKGMEMASSASFDIILLDIMLPGLDGIEICKRLRKRNINTPIIMLTSKSHEIDRVVGLEIGADDYVTKPFSPRELQARVKAVLRRTNRNDSPAQKGTYNFGDLYIDVECYQVFKRDQEIRLTAMEFALLKFFLENNSKVLTRNEILKAVWENNVVVELRTVDTHIANLRKKLEDDPVNPKWILGIRGVGYRMVLE